MPPKNGSDTQRKSSNNFHSVEEQDEQNKVQDLGNKKHLVPQMGIGQGAHLVADICKISFIT